MAVALFKRTICSKFTLRNSSHAPNSYSSLSDGKGRLAKNELLRRALAEGVPADHANRVASFCQKAIGSALREKKYQEYRYLLMRGREPILQVAACLSVATLLAAIVDNGAHKKEK